jgi:hypothetical protein
VLALPRSLHFTLVAVGAVAFAATVHAPAWAQGKLEARYTASLAGIPIGNGSWAIDITDTSYTAAASGVTTGLLHAFTGGEGTSTARGTLQAGQPLSSTYATTITTGKKNDEVQLTINNGTLKDFKVDPPQDNDAERVPITEAHQHGILDPMTASLLRTPGNGDPLSAEVCQRSQSIFDGRLRYDLQFAFKRMDKVNADKGYADRRPHPVAHGDQIHRKAARHRDLAGADRGYARVGAVPHGRPDADRPGRAGGHPVHLGREPTPGVGQWSEDAMTVCAKCA